MGKGGSASAQTAISLWELGVWCSASAERCTYRTHRIPTETPGPASSAGKLGSHHSFDVVVHWVRSHEVLIPAKTVGGWSKDTGRAQEESAAVGAIWKGFPLQCSQKQSERFKNCLQMNICTFFYSEETVNEN